LYSHWMSAGAAPMAKTPSRALRTVTLARDIWCGLPLWELKAQTAAPTTRPTRQATRAIQRFLDAWNERRRPFVWVKTADQVLRRYKQKLISGPVH